MCVLNLVTCVGAMAAKRPLPSSGRSMLFLRHVFTCFYDGCCRGVGRNLHRVCCLRRFPSCDGGIDEPTEERWTKYLREMIARHLLQGPRELQVATLEGEPGVSLCNWDFFFLDDHDDRIILHDMQKFC